MSGPTVVFFSLESSAASVSVAPLGAVVLAAAALSEARAMGQEYDAVLANVNARAEDMTEKHRRLQEAQLQRRTVLTQETARLESRLAHLQDVAAALAQRLPAQAAALASIASIQRPQDDSQDALLRHAEALRAEIRRLEDLLAAVGAALDAQWRDTLAQAMQPAAGPGLEDQLHAYAAQRSLRPGLNPQQAEIFRRTVERVLGRLESAPDSVLPAEVETLAREIMLAPSLERAESLALELRLRVQQHQQMRALLQARTAEMKAWLDALPNDAPADLRDALEAAAAGLAPLAPEQESAARQYLEALRAARARQEQEAAAQVLEQSLRDLGYEVEGIERTLFVEGGVAHFQRQGWEDYHVRLRLDPRENTMSFNVVRPRGLEESAVRKRQDFLAEERWCAEFPKLKQTLAARGIEFNVLRQMGAGELPVQTVDPASLPRRREEDAARETRAPLQKGFS
jgi:hypothetical protein